MYDDYKAAWTQLTAPGADFEVVTANVRGVDIRTYANAPANLRDVWLSTAAFADRDYLVYENERLTYAQTHQRVAALANWLIAQGVKPGDRVAIAMRNYPEWMQAYWATMSVGAAVVGMNAWWIGPEMLYALQDSTPKVMILDKERLDQLGEHRAEVSDVALVGVRFPEAEAGVTPWDDVVAGDSPLPMLDIDTDSDACIFYTSGTTGRPKARSSRIAAASATSLACSSPLAFSVCSPSRKVWSMPTTSRRLDVPWSPPPVSCHRQQLRRTRHHTWRRQANPHVQMGRRRSAQAY